MASNSIPTGEQENSVDEILTKLQSETVGITSAHHKGYLKDNQIVIDLTTEYDEAKQDIENLIAERERLVKVRSVIRSLDIVSDFRGSKWSAAEELPQPFYDTLADSFHYGAEYVIELIREEIQSELAQLEGPRSQENQKGAHD